MTLSNVWAVKHGCPTSVYVEFTDGGPRVATPEEGSPRHEEGSPEEESRPVLEWAPPCSRMNSQIDFDQEPVAKVTGEPTQESCRDAAQEALGSGTTQQGYNSRALAVGDQFCEDFAPGGRVVLMQVKKLSGTPVAEITLAITVWAGQPEEKGKPAQPGEMVYANKPFTLGDKLAKANDCGLGYANIASDAPIVNYKKGVAFGSSEDITYFPSCLTHNPKVRFEGYVARVKGNAGIDVTACQNAAAGGASGSLDVRVSELKTGSRYCRYDSLLDSVALVKVTAVTSTSPASVHFSATRWEAPEAS
ncbi:hypothetical protein [Streptomyces sp. NEAU-YJ-81]|uniref:hypothetical protein n=1 Tax=Streptomyces sp. NEAU-YJ-81 TaxID=2820288 RepID=UPI001ABBE596|nr:hypothetical protein [Streptomyces sp. NEAU-YJ-81]MBO3678732.1 hypothetical protein [Streptomyces sp. NEAU-YJ-81]